MRVAVQHNTTRDSARRTVEKKLDSMLRQFGGQAEEVHHEWIGDTLHFKGKARGMSLAGEVEITDASVIVDAKLPLLARAFEGRIREAVEKEVGGMFEPTLRA